MIGQYSDEEFMEKYESSGNMKFMNVRHGQRHAMIRYGKSTYNYYHQHEDGSWTNYDCKTSHSFGI